MKIFCITTDINKSTMPISYMKNAFTILITLGVILIISFQVLKYMGIIEYKIQPYNVHDSDVSTSYWKEKSLDSIIVYSTKPVQILIKSRDALIVFKPQGEDYGYIKAHVFKGLKDIPYESIEWVDIESNSYTFTLKEWTNGRVRIYEP